MRPFQLNSEMRTMRGVFYPTGWLVLLFPGEQQAREAARKLAGGGVAEDRMMLMTPADFQREIAGTEGDDAILPSAGTEGDTVRKMADLVARGHHGLFIHAPEQAASDRVMELLRDVPMSFGQKYRMLVIEDVVE
ncbi:MAG TPA: RNA-binding protein [Ramlibacter sp.]|uniref:RNA-binding protein n=1 Tax=Ramlibacter sp. TaxID=1917967 RepID=UPI002D8065ED|nr:RNA-binding protein [Ramlibacter sp.]HET8747381.1 RNA-binding protein [Ramlibacter sp.]